MELNWTTFFLEMINFIILVWLLKRFLYGPVKKAMEDRKSAIENTLQKADTARIDAETLKMQFESRLDEWKAEKEDHRVRFLGDLEREKQAIYAQFQKQMEVEKEQSVYAAKKKIGEYAERAEKEAFALSMSFAKKMLTELADAPMETKLINLALDRMEEENDGLPGIAALPDKPFAKIRSAYPPDPGQRERLLTILKKKISDEFDYSWDVEPELIAGLEISLGPYLIEANLKNEMQFFYERNPSGPDVV